MESVEAGDICNACTALPSVELTAAVSESIDGVEANVLAAYRHQLGDFVLLSVVAHLADLSHHSGVLS